MEAVLSIQSAVAYGHVGNSVAVFVLQRLGFDVWPVDTVQFSNHTGYGTWRGLVHETADIDAIVSGIAELGVFGGCRAVLSGYLGDATIGRSVLRALELVRAACPDALYVCDPVMGDDGRGPFVRPEIPGFFRDHAVPRADIVTPNRFELASLAERRVESVGEALAAAADLRERGPRLVAVTSLALPDRPEAIAVLLDCAEGSWLAATPRLPIAINGGGDAFTALLLGHFLRSGDPVRALELALAAMQALVAATHDLGRSELALIAAQDSLADPPASVHATRLR